MISVNFRKNDTAFPRLLAKKLNDLQSNIAGKSDTGHTHEMADVTGLQTALDGKVSTTTTIAGVNLQDNITKAELLTALNVEDGADDNIIESITVNGNSATIDASTKTASVTIPEASQSASGVMSSADKTKLDNLETIKGIKSNEKIVSLTQDTDLLQTTLSIAIEQGSAGTADEGKTFIRLKGIGGAEVSSVDASSFVIDGMLQSAEIYSYDGTTWTPSTPTGGTVPSTAGVYIRLSWNSDAGGQVSYLDVSTLIDAYTAGNGLELSANNEFSIKIDSTPGNVTLTTSANGLKANVDLSGKQDTLTAGTNISINNNTVSAKGYVYDDTKKSFAEGWNTTASGIYSHAEGYSTEATGDASHTEGWNTTASGYSSHAEGSSTTASNHYSHAEGWNTTASGYSSHAEGDGGRASGYASHTEGFITTAQNDYEHAEGTYNKSNKQTTGTDVEKLAKSTLHSIGIGTDNNDRKNAVEVMKSGDVYIKGLGGYDGTNPGNGSTPLHQSVKTIQTPVADPTASGNATAFIDSISQNENGEITVTKKNVDLSGKQDALTAGTNIDITNNTISAKGYVYDDTKQSFAEGNNIGNNINIASGNNSHAEGYATVAFGESSHTEGYSTEAKGAGSHTEGKFTFASGESSHAEGTDTTAIGNHSHAEGNSTIAYGENSHVEGTYDFVDVGGIWEYDDNSTIIREHNESGGISDIYVNQIVFVKDGDEYVYRKVVSVGETSFTVDKAIVHGETNAYISTVLGGIAYGRDSHAEGMSNAIGDYSHAEGSSTTASGPSSHAEGTDTTASGNVSHTEGISTTATVSAAHAEGDCTTAAGCASHAEGHSTTASGDYSHSGGYNTIANQDNMTAIGKYNKYYRDDLTTTLFIVGDGAENSRHNAFEVINEVGTDTTYSTRATVNSFDNVLLGMPIGSVVLWSGDVDGSYGSVSGGTPDGWRLCDGSYISAISASSTDYDFTISGRYYKAEDDIYRPLCKVIGTKYGNTTPSYGIVSIILPDIPQVSNMNYIIKYK